jgi:hypothetical protein
MALDEFCHQPIQCTATRGNELQDLFTLALPVKRSPDRFDLPLDTTDTGDVLALLFDVGHFHETSSGLCIHYLPTSQFLPRHGFTPALRRAPVAEPHNAALAG